MKFADQIFLKGQKYLAEPKDLLNKRYHQFQRRMTRRFLNSADEAEEEKPAKKPALANHPSSEAGSRRGLGGISSSSNTNSHAPMAIKAPSTKNEIVFDIYDENAGPAPQKKAVVPKWNNFGSEPERRKENDGM